ncbi:subtilisin-like protease SBT1.1 isoform X4 [Arachis hypogaea]|uniref:subtilisin-like protease SBT1.1 isoform X4 n=1 Tax=Arachis hypogaea TaxID=3818 RepID=UPI003B2226AE
MTNFKYNFTFVRIMISRLLFIFFALVVTNSMSMMVQKTYIVHMDRTKIRASIHSQDITKPWFESVIDSISESSTQEEQEQEILPPRLLYVYETNMFGFAVCLSQKQLESLSKVDGFLSALPDELLTLHTTHTPNFLGLKNGIGLWSAQNLASDVIIGIIDSGIWPEHISFKDSGLSSVPSHWKGICEQGTKFSASNCNKKLIGARTYLKGYEKSVGKINDTADYRSPRDSIGHGTHTASTAAGSLVKNASFYGLASGSASGMRKTSRIAAYKACWPAGCVNSDILAAMDQAVSDGVDVLSLSLGNYGPHPSTVGNSAPWIMTVAASYTDRTFPTKVRLGRGEVFRGSSLYHGRKTSQLPLVYAKSAGANKEAQYCTENSLDQNLVKGKIVACEKGLNSRTEKGMVVQKAGGAGMILLNSESQGGELLADPHILPATSLGASESSIVRNYIRTSKNTPTASISFLGTKYGEPAPAMAAFSSRGPNYFGLDVIKPDVTAPGVNILAAWPAKVSPSLLKSDKRSVMFNIISGTSMSCPHVSGIAALIKSVHKDWSPAAIKSALMTTAYILNNKGDPIRDAGSNNSASATPFAFGSGHVNPESASDPGLVYDINTQDYLNYLCSLNYTDSEIALVSRENFVCPKNSVLQAGDLNYPSFSVLFDRVGQNSSVTYKRVVTNVAKSQSANYVVNVEQPRGVSATVEPRKLKFEKMGQKLSYSVTFSSIGKRLRDAGSNSFGSLTWVSGKYYKVRSPIAVTWQ